METFKKYKYLVLLVFALHFFFLAGMLSGNELLYLILGIFFFSLAVRDYFHRCRH